MPTGYVYDEIYTRHTQAGHPENASRLSAIMSYLSERGLLARLEHIPARPARREELLRCHHPRYLELVEQTSRNGGGMLDPDTYTNEHSWPAALMAAGGAVELTAAVLQGRLDNGFALVRPPGHHATATRAMGFCLLANVAVAARAARLDHGLERVAIVDFDVHHGNGTQAILNEDPTVMFVSSHQYPFYPGSGDVYETGVGPARGTKVNLPLPPHVGDEGYRRLYGDVVFPLLRRFQPQMILVSAGFDAHWDDPLAMMGLSLSGYAWLARQLVALAREICAGRIVFVLEGGYNLQVLAPGVGNVFRALLGTDEVDDPLGDAPWPESDVSGLLRELQRVHQLP